MGKNNKLAIIAIIICIVGVGLFLGSSSSYAAQIQGQNIDSATGSTFFESMVSGWQKNFVQEDRYKLFVDGLCTTVIITLGAAIFGTALALAVCLMRRSEQRFLSMAALMYIRLVQGMPVVVLLLILYYVVFAATGLSDIAVATIAFGINFSAYVAEMMRSGIDTVDKGQIEAGKALGFDTLAIYKKIIYPQALVYVLPVYKGEFISMLKMTSVVGYIAIQDLTRVSDIIRERTYDAFFPLIVTAVGYFVVAYVFIYFLNRIESGVDPKRRNRALDKI